jgi:ASC-1-like (ASCH) protein
VHESIEALSQYQGEYALESLHFLLKMVKYRGNYSKIQPLLAQDDVAQTIAFAIRKLSLEVAKIRQTQEYEGLKNELGFTVPEIESLEQHLIQNDIILIDNKEYALGIAA